jgi:hypothetical protein
MILKYNNQLINTDLVRYYEISDKCIFLVYSETHKLSLYFDTIEDTELTFDYLKTNDLNGYLDNPKNQKKLKNIR